MPALTGRYVVGMLSFALFCALALATVTTAGFCAERGKYGYAAFHVGLTLINLIQATLYLAKEVLT